MTIFAILGNLAHNLKVDDIENVVQSGSALAFISYPDTISKFDVAPQVSEYCFRIYKYFRISNCVALTTTLY